MTANASKASAEPEAHESSADAVVVEDSRDVTPAPSASSAEQIDAELLAGSSDQERRDHAGGARHRARARSPAPLKRRASTSLRGVVSSGQPEMMAR